LQAMFVAAVIVVAGFAMPGLSLYIAGEAVNNRTKTVSFTIDHDWLLN
jgi:hypothetical protein